MIKLSQCMIVKNEESNIEQALSWAKDIAYEQIVVDTGSTDRTVELAEKMGATVYHFEWNDNFAEAKNYAISKATGDWIAFLDADEYFNEEDAKKLLPCLEKLQYTKYINIRVSMLHLDDEGKVFLTGVHNRIFRNMEGLQYYNAVHENLALNRESIDAYSLNLIDELTVFHTGYAKKESRAKQKGERNIRILLKLLDKRPKDRAIMGYLGDSYLSMDDNKNAREWFEKAVDSLEPPVEENDLRTSMSFFCLMKILYLQGEFSRFFEIYEQAVRVVPEEADFDYLMSFYWIVQGNDFTKGLFYLESAFDKLKANRESFYGKNLKGEMQKALEMRAACYYNTQNLVKCVEDCVLLLKENPFHFGITHMLLEAFYRDEAKGGASAREVLQFLANLYSLQNLKDKIYLLKAAMQIHYESLIQEIRKLFTPEELVALDSSMGN